MQTGIFFLTCAVALIHLSRSKLLFVYEHFRHGARGPYEGVDESGKDVLGFEWKNLGELTSVGERMHYLLGRRNKLKYEAFLSKQFDPKELLVISTNYNRTIQSALAHLQGMYTPSNMVPLEVYQLPKAIPPNTLRDETKTKLASFGHALEHNIDVVTFHTFHKSDKCYLLYELKASSKCEPVDEIRLINQEHKKITEIVSQFNTDFGPQLKLLFNDAEKEKRLEDFSFLNMVCDHFMANVYDGRSMTRLTDKKIDTAKLNETCLKILDLQHLQILFGDVNQDLVKKGFTPSMKQILHYIQRRVDLDLKKTPDVLEYESPKFLIHSGHDSSLTGMQMFLTLAFNTAIAYPRFASNLYFELKKVDENPKGDESDYSVDYIYEDSLVKTIPYTIFKQNITALLQKDEDISTFCRTPVAKSTQLSKKYLLVSITVFLAVVCALVIGGIVYMFVSVKFSKKKDQPGLSSDLNSQMVH